MSDQIATIKRFLPKSRFLRAVTVLAGGTALGQGLTILASPILTRLYAPEEFGVLAVYASILGILSIVPALRYELAIPLPEDDDAASNLLALSLGLTCVNSLLLLLGVFFFGASIVRLTNTQVLQPYLWLVPVGFLGVGLYQTFSYWAVRKKAYTVISRTKMTQSIGQVLTQAVLGITKLGPLGLLLGHVVGQVSGIGTLVHQAWSNERDCLRKVRWSRVLWVANRYRRFPLYMSGASLLNQAGSQLPALLLAAFYGPQVAGWFFLAQKVLGVPVQLIAISVSQVFIGEAAQLVKTDIRALKALIHKIVTRFFLIGFPFCIIVGIGGGWFFSFIFGGDWKMSGIFVQVMALYYLLKFSLDSLTVLQLLERQDLLFLWNLMRLVLATSAFVAATLLKLSPLLAVAMFSAAMSISYLVKYMIWSVVLNRISSQESKKYS
jgi:O-antigen/teichoic acid export membrane protein